MRYIILEASSITDLSAKVEEYISRGWEPQGGMSAASNQTLVWWYYQAMVHRVPERE
jgi:Domain of unknown function (DUF1737)